MSSQDLNSNDSPVGANTKFKLCAEEHHEFVFRRNRILASSKDDDISCVILESQLYWSSKRVMNEDPLRRSETECVGDAASSDLIKSNLNLI